MTKQLKEFPLEIKISFHKVIEQYQREVNEIESSISRKYLQEMLDYISDYPALAEGFNDLELLKEYREPIKILLDDLFPSILTNNEIKAASIPFHDVLFNKSKRLKQILANAGEDFELTFRNTDEDMIYIFSCIQILKHHYDFQIDVSRPLYYDIPDENGIQRHYRIAMNADFVEIIKKDDAPEISQEDVDRLLQNVDDSDLWKEKFPPGSYIFKGFTIVNLTDVTIDDAISELKTTLLFEEVNEAEELQQLQEIFRSIYKISDLRVGFTVFNHKEMIFERMENDDARSFILNNKLANDCETGICKKGFQKLIDSNTYFTISNVEDYLKENDNLLARNLAENKIKSCLLAPIAKNGKLLGILELVSQRKNELNSINAIKLDDILPYIVSTVERNRNDFENRIKAVIQSECTSIHPSVLWVFEKEAKKFIRDLDKDGLASFKDITFKDVYPLYGQIDIVASSEARNEAIKQDLLDQLEIILNIIEKAYQIEELPIYDQVKYRISDFREELLDKLNASSEQKVFNLLQKEVNPLMSHLKKQSAEIRELVDEYSNMLNPETGLVYNHRKKYDDTVQQINRTMSRYIDKKQVQAQEIYPHYFERYKTDGVDHNMYIGASMANKRPFNKVYLFNLRLWQLSTMCEMENRFYQLQEKTPINLEAASLILVYNSTMSIRYRMDEKKFDVDGTYNARYEIIKKRIDKAFVKGTEERVTQKGKMTIVYSQGSDEREYLQYIKYLQAKKYFGDQVELLKLEDVQGVVGLKAIRVNILYTPDSNQPDKVINYEDLMEELH
ncbi:GAF domain-containing protein [Christiangramia sabulilitoris]|uniref:GAF domain-containing protein n=1 Tax=Christiangramia sabulilitoris TaxID=2583991 RepID=A0A550I2F1_9FLAO|nr:GAF domain-containing protein [Christiangramia sabulilitoris]TRO65130.1 GAF domain-containing protein [Christiangramia sabulilitoris]